MTADTDLSMIFLDLVVGQNDKEEILTTLVARIPPRCCPLLLPSSTVTKQPPPLSRCLPDCLPATV